MTSSGTLSGVDLALLNSRLERIVRSMMNSLRRTARSSILSMGRDFSCAILTADDELLTVADSIPIHVFRGPDLMASVMRQFHPELRPGDAYLHNSPYHGNSHAADWSILVPVFDDNGRHRYTSFVKGHLADCGNSIPATRHFRARDVYEEGALIFPCVKVESDYEQIEDVVRMCKIRIRVPDFWYGDFLALLGAARLGERLLVDMVRDTDAGRLEAFPGAWFDYSERRVARAIGRLPSGSVRITGRYDPVPGFPEGIPINVALDVNATAARVSVDLRDNIDCQPMGLNLTESTAYTAALVGVFSGLSESVPTNAGSFRRVDVHLRENCIVGIPRHPFSCSMATTHLAERVAKFVAMGLAELADGFGMAEVGCTLPAAWSKISGHDPRHDRVFTDGLVLGTTHGAGTPHADGWLTLAGIGAAGTMMRDSIEIDELRYPVLIHEERLIPDSEGAGYHRGAPGAHVEFGPTHGPIEVIGGSDGTVFAPRGVRGGGEGAPAHQYKRLRDGSLTDDLGWGFRVTVEPGERIVSMCCGGGGYGPPLERDPRRVQRDVAEGWVTRERAEAVYGIVLDERGDVDGPSTAGRRAAATQPTP
jgi:N-methylhydantoinase B